MATNMQPLNCYRYVVYTMNDFFNVEATKCSTV